MTKLLWYDMNLRYEFVTCHCATNFIGEITDEIAQHAEDICGKTTRELSKTIDLSIELD